MTYLKKPALSNPGGVVEFDYHEGFKVTQDMKDVFNWDGIIMVKNLLSTDEIGKIHTVLSLHDEITGKGWDLADGEGKACRLMIWNQPGHDVTGMVARTQKVAGTCEALLGGEVYHYHTKLMMKDALSGGKCLWHQDYGYWYKNGITKPDLMTCFIPLDPCKKENGCLQVIKGTQRCGRIEHVLTHGQTVANQERIDMILTQPEFEHVFVEMNPGDALFFHANLLHTSDCNVSPTRRWCFVVSYNRADNNPLKEHHHPFYSKLDMVPDDAIMNCDNVSDMSGKDFMDPTKDETVRATLAESNYH